MSLRVLLIIICYTLTMCIYWSKKVSRDSHCERIISMMVQMVVCFLFFCQSTFELFLRGPQGDSTTVGGRSRPPVCPAKRESPGEWEVASNRFWRLPTLSGRAQYGCEVRIQQRWTNLVAIKWWEHFYQPDLQLFWFVLSTPVSYLFGYLHTGPGPPYPTLLLGLWH